MINSNGQIQTVFGDFAKGIETKNLIVCENDKRSFEQFKSLPTPSKKEIDEEYQRFVDKRNPDHDFGKNKNETNTLIETNTSQNISGTNSEISSSSNEF